jgi:hypothetical protein
MSGRAWAPRRARGNGAVCGARPAGWRAARLPPRHRARALDRPAALLIAPFRGPRRVPAGPRSRGAPRPGARRATAKWQVRWACQGAPAVARLRGVTVARARGAAGSGARAIAGWARGAARPWRAPTGSARLGARSRARLDRRAARPRRRARSARARFAARGSARLGIGAGAPRTARSGRRALPWRAPQEGRRGARARPRGDVT